MVTGATLYKTHLFKTPEDLDHLQALLFELAQQYQWYLEAWALFSNHYHLVAHSPDDPSTLGTFVRHLHASSARTLNGRHRTPGRKVWYQYWDTKITFQNSYLARLKYVLNNPRKHGMVEDPRDYPWCSACWFERTATKSHFQTVQSFETDKVHVLDDF